MRIRSLVVVSVALVCALAFASTASAQDPTGVWKVNLAKSKYSPGPAPKSSTNTTTAADGGFKSVTDTVPATGAAVHTENSWKFDGKDNPVKGNPNADTLAYTKVDARHYTVVAKKGGKVTVTSKIEVSADGKSRTSTQSGTDAQGKPVSNVIWSDKQ